MNPLRSTFRPSQSSSKFLRKRSPIPADSTIASTFSWRDQESIVQLAEPVQTASESRTTYL
jgi:hypothetical protein